MEIHQKVTARHLASYADWEAAKILGKRAIVTIKHIQLKPGFHYPSWRPELTARVDGWPVSINGPCWRVMETGHPSTRAVNSGSGNRA